MKLFQLIICTITLTSVAMGDALIFDFGPKESPLRKGAIHITKNGGEHAAWNKTDDLKSHKNEIVKEWIENKSRGKKMPPAVYQNELTCDHVASSQPQSLKLNVPPGPYDVILLCGRSGKRTSQVWDINVTDGSAKATATFAGGYELRKLQFETTATEKGIELQFTTRSRWLVNAIIVIPEADRKSAQTNLIDPIMKECFMLPPEEMTKWKERPRPCTLPEPKWTEKQRKDGVAVFSRPWNAPVWPAHFPQQHELDAPVRAFASQNEYEPLTFTLHSLKDFSNISVNIEELLNTAGGRKFTISESNIDLRFVRYMKVRPNYSTYNTYYRAPDVLMPWKPQSLMKGENLRLWITIKTGTSQPAGIYNGNVSVTADNTSISIPISLRVLPISLQKDQSLVYGQYYRHPLDKIVSAPDEFSRAWWQHKARTEHVDMREHGMNTVVLGLGGYWKNERWNYYFDQLQHKIDLYRSVGFDKPIVCHFPCGSLYRKYMKAGMGSHLSLIKMPPDEFFTELTDMVQTIKNEARRRQWPEILYYPVDEPSTAPISVEFMTRTMASIKKVPGVRTYVTADPEHEQFAPMRPYIDVWCCQPFSLGRKAVLADMKKRGVKYWCYPNHISGENDHTTTIGARMTYGFGLWESGYRALVPWIYQYSNGDPWNNLDSSTQEFFNRTADDGSPIPVTLWEADREGIDDHRYIFTLQNAIDRARETGQKEAADKAQSTLNTIFNAIEVQPKYKNDGLWEAGSFDAWRWTIAEQILALQKLN
jgi:hypothetical protein